MTTASRQFTLRGLLVFTGIIGLGCGLAMAGEMTTVKGIVLLAIGQRILAIAFVSAVIGLVMGSVSKVAIAVSTGVLLADLALFVFLYFVWYPPFSWCNTYSGAFLANPIAVLALIVYPVVAATNRAHALTIGISLWIILPFIAVGLFLIQYPHGWALILLSIMAAIATFVGVIGTRVARILVEKWDRIAGTLE
jgi:hypothetical protein